jgi:integrase
MTTIKVGNTLVKIYHCTGPKKPGRTQKRYGLFRVAYRLNGEQQRETFGSLAKAKARANEIAVMIERGERDVLKLTNADRSSYLHALQLLKPMSVPLHVAVEEYVANAQRKPKHCPNKLVADVVAELLEDKQTHGASIRYIQSLRQSLNRFAHRFHTNIGSVTARLIEQWLTSLKVGPRSRNNHRMSVITLFHYARKHGYLPREAQTEADLVDKVKDHGKKIEILTPAQMTKLMGSAKEETALYFALAGFAGIRAAELLRLEWKDFRRDSIEVAKEKSKTATRRLVPITPNLAEWLQPYRQRKGWLFSGKADKRARAFGKRVLKLPRWPQNALRDSFASYRLAATADAARVALELGNSPAKLFSNYRELADEHDAAAWFAIAPKRSANVLPFAASN